MINGKAKLVKMLYVSHHGACVAGRWVMRGALNMTIMLECYGFI